jgi:hypothetical protein
LNNFAGSTATPVGLGDHSSPLPATVSCGPFHGKALVRPKAAAKSSSPDEEGIVNEILRSDQGGKQSRGAKAGWEGRAI